MQDILDKYLFGGCKECDDIIDQILAAYGVQYPNEFMLIESCNRNSCFDNKWSEFDSEAIAEYKPFYFNWRIDMYKDVVKAKLGEQLTILNDVGIEISKLAEQGGELMKNLSSSMEIEKNQEINATYDLTYAINSLLNLIGSAQGQIESTIKFADGIETL